MKGNIVVFEDGAYKGRFTATEFLYLTVNRGVTDAQRESASRILIDGGIVKIGDLKAYVDYGDAHTSNTVTDIGHAPEVPSELTQDFKVGDKVASKVPTIAGVVGALEGEHVCVGDIFTIEAFRANRVVAIARSVKSGRNVRLWVPDLERLDEEENPW